MNPVAMPTSATTHIQNTAPGPPKVMARATPTMLPVPTREARPMVNAWKEEMPASPSREPAMARSIWPNRRNCTPRVRTVNQTPAAMSSQARKLPYRWAATLLSQSAGPSKKPAVGDSTAGSIWASGIGSSCCPRGYGQPTHPNLDRPRFSEVSSRGGPEVPDHPQRDQTSPGSRPGRYGLPAATNRTESAARVPAATSAR